MIAIGSDHAGFDLKTALIAKLQEWGHEVDDCGTYSSERADYPKFAHAVAGKVESNEAHFGVLICGSANGVAITANKHSAIRCAIAWTEELARLARAHNDANVLALPARFIDPKEAENALAIFLTEPFEGGRHADRVKLISAC